jgi:hypothetical protein
MPACTNGPPEWGDGDRRYVSAYESKAFGITMNERHLIGVDPAGPDCQQCPTKPPKTGPLKGPRRAM